MGYSNYKFNINSILSYALLALLLIATPIFVKSLQVQRYNLMQAKRALDSKNYYEAINQYSNVITWSLPLTSTSTYAMEELLSLATILPSKKDKLYALRELYSATYSLKSPFFVTKLFLKDPLTTVGYSKDKLINLIALLDDRNNKDLIVAIPTVRKPRYLFVFLQTIFFVGYIATLTCFLLTNVDKNGRLSNKGRLYYQMALPFMFLSAWFVSLVFA